MFFCFFICVILLVALVVFIGVLTFKCMMFLDALAKKAELSEYEYGVGFSGLDKLRKRNRSEKTIRSKLKNRLERYGGSVRK